MTLEDLYEEAQQYGIIDVFQSGRDRTFSCSITFPTISGIELKARSGFKHETPKSAMMAALENARTIRATILGAAAPQPQQGTGWAEKAKS